MALFIDECMRDALKTIGELEKSGKTANWDMFRDQCHALKGVAGNMGAMRLVERGVSDDEARELAAAARVASADRADCASSLKLRARR